MRRKVFPRTGNDYGVGVRCFGRWCGKGAEFGVEVLGDVGPQMG